MVRKAVKEREREREEGERGRENWRQKESGCPCGNRETKRGSLSESRIDY